VIEVEVLVQTVDERRQSVAGDVLGYDEHRLLGLDELLEQRHNLINVIDLGVGERLTLPTEPLAMVATLWRSSMPVTRVASSLTLLARDEGGGAF
jgi:hypothetical protein